MEVRARGYEINVQTLVSVTIFAQATASKILKIYPPAPLGRRVSGKIVQRGRRPLADYSNVVPDLRGQIVNMLRIPRVVLISHAAAFGNSWEFTPRGMQRANNKVRTAI